MFKQELRQPKMISSYRYRKRCQTATFVLLIDVLTVGEQGARNFDISGTAAPS